MKRNLIEDMPQTEFELQAIDVFRNQRIESPQGQVISKAIEENKFNELVNGEPQ